MKSCKSNLLITLSLIVFPVISQAALGPIVVTGTRTEQPLSESAVPVQIITSEQIRNSVATDVADIIEIYSGLDIARNGDFGKVTSLFIRGSESNHTVILINGVKINPSTIGGAALQNISPDIIERIEIVKGPRSSLYGSEAIGGVINIITRKQVDGRSGKVRIGMGEFGTRKTNISGFFGNNNLSSGITIEQFNTDGFPVQDASTENHGFDNETVNAFVDYQMDRSDLRLSHWSAKGNVEYFLAGFPPFTSDQELDQDFKNTATALVWNFAISSDISTNLHHSSITDDIQQNQPNFLAQFDFARTDRTETELKVDFQTGDSSAVSLGLLSAEEDVDALSFGTTINQTTDINAAYVLLQVHQEKHNYAIAARQTDHEDFGTHNTWNIDYKLMISEAASIHAGAGTAFRAPDNTDRFGFYGNPNLDPETSESIELGLTYALSNNASFAITYFDNTIEDLIELNGSFTQMINVDEVEISGIEVNYQARRNNWTYSLNLLSQDPRNKITNEVLSRRSKNRIGINLDYQQASWQAGGNISIVGERDNSSFDSIILDRYELVNVFARYRLDKSANISAKIENLFDEDYETASGFNTRGRTAFIEFSYSFGE
ncbi:MAG: TonB-dependent receptor [Proteobacteria bacterium]|nr:TonB-dependent receptor [Pseudomonadota bacterium]